jgi:hypothetical protein
MTGILGILESSARNDTKLLPQLKIFFFFFIVTTLVYGADWDIWAMDTIMVFFLSVSASFVTILNNISLSNWSVHFRVE